MSETNFTETDRKWMQQIAALGIPPAARAVHRAIAEIDSLRGRLRDAQEAANCGGPPTGRTCSVDGHAIFGGFRGEAGIDGPVMCDMCWLNHVEAERDSLRAQLGEAQRQRDTARGDAKHYAAQRDCANALIHLIMCAVEESGIGERASEWDVLDGSVRQIVADRTTLRSENERLREALRLIQWGAKDWMSNYCLRCRQGEPMGHAPDCEVGAALAGATVKQSLTVQPEGEEVERLKDVLREVRDQVTASFGCNHPERFDETGDECDGDDCIRCWVDITIDAAITAKAQSETGGAA